MVYKQQTNFSHHSEAFKIQDQIQHLTRVSVPKMAVLLCPCLVGKASELTQASCKGVQPICGGFAFTT